MPLPRIPGGLGGGAEASTSCDGPVSRRTWRIDADGRSHAHAGRAARATRMPPSPRRSAASRAPASPASRSASSTSASVETQRLSTSITRPSRHTARRHDDGSAHQPGPLRPVAPTLDVGGTRRAARASCRPPIHRHATEYVNRPRPGAHATTATRRVARRSASRWGVPPRALKTAGERAPRCAEGATKRRIFAGGRRPLALGHARSAHCRDPSRSQQSALGVKANAGRDCP